MAKAKTERNIEIFTKRSTDPQKWTWGELANLCNISRERVREIYEEEKERQNTLSTAV